MRRRQQQPQQKSQQQAVQSKSAPTSFESKSEQTGNSSYFSSNNNIDPESSASSSSSIVGLPREIMVKSPARTPMAVSTAFEVDSGSADGRRNKPLSVWPRNYTGRRQLIFAGCCFLVMLVVVQVSKGGNDNGK